jgi:hypothetical protein
VSLSYKLVYHVAVESTYFIGVLYSLKILGQVMNMESKKSWKSILLVKDHVEDGDKDKKAMIKAVPKRNREE